MNGTIFADFAELEAALERMRRKELRIVTTNGCFDVLHPGHVRFLGEARALGDALIVGINDDASVRRLKGPSRPVFGQAERAEQIAALRSVDGVVIFGEDDPCRLLEHIRPNIHCKGGDYRPEEIIERDTVLRAGGELRLLRLQPGYSTSKVLAHQANVVPNVVPVGSVAEHEHARALVLEPVGAIELTARHLSAQVFDESVHMSKVLEAGGTIFSCGNGGSAADAQHFTAELVGRFERERRGFRAIALNADTAVMTSLANDYQFESVFSRQIDALGRPGDLLFAISTSGRSPNVLRAVETANRLGLHTTALTGPRRCPLGQVAQHTLSAAGERTALIQQTHRAILHALCRLIETRLAGVRA